MIPILWLFLLQRYLRLLAVSVSAFIAMLLVTRFKEIARFIALSEDATQILCFIVYQLPLILPIAIPISSLIASTILLQYLSKTHQLMAMRACGVSLPFIITPLVFAAILLSLLNFSICAEVVPSCKAKTKTMLYEKTSTNPLVLLQRQNLSKVKRAYLNIDVKDQDESAKNLLLVVYNSHNKRLNLFQAIDLFVSDLTFTGGNISAISHVENATTENDLLIIENQEVTSSSTPLLSKLLKKGKSKFSLHALHFNLLLLHYQSLEGSKSAFIEILCRLSLSISVFSFTLLGCSFAINVQRISPKKHLWVILFFTFSVFFGYFIGKEMKNYFNFGILALLLPHLLIWISSGYRLYQIRCGG